MLEDGGSRLYLSSHRDPFPAPPIIRYDTGGDSLFPRRCILPLDQLHAAIEEYILTGQQPADMEQIGRSDLPQLDPRW